MFWLQLINGLMVGSIYALIAIGYTLVFGVLKLLNLAHGEVFMVSGFIGLFLLAAHLPLWAALLGSALGGGILGLLVERLCFRPIKSEYHLAPLLSTIGFGLILATTVLNLWGSEPNILPETIKPIDIHLGPVLISSVQLVILLISFGLMVAIQLTIQKTKLGKAMRAIAEDPTVASLLGVNTDRVVMWTFFVSSALAGVAGLLVALRVGKVSPIVGFTIGIKAVAVMFVGGLGNVNGAMVAGLLLGILEVLTVAYGSATYADAVAWGLLIIVLLVRPKGLFGSTPQGTRG